MLSQYLFIHLTWLNKEFMGRNIRHKVTTASLQWKKKNLSENEVQTTQLP